MKSIYLYLIFFIIEIPVVSNVREVWNLISLAKKKIYIYIYTHTHTYIFILYIYIYIYMLGGEGRQRQFGKQESYKND